MGEMPARLHVDYEAGPTGTDVEVYVDGKYVLGATHDQLGSQGVAAVAGCARHVAAALAAVPVRPKLEIATPEGDSYAEIYVNGKLTADSSDAPVVVARCVARALGADVDEVADPMPEPYVYRVAWHAGGRFGSCWVARSSPIDDEFSEAETRAAIARQEGVTAPIVFLSIEYIDGPY